MLYGFIFLLILVISLFVLFVLSENDFILIRRNLTLTVVFNRAFIAMFIAFLFGRFFYAVDNFQILFLNPLVFLNFLKNPGFSIWGAFLGFIAAILYQTPDKKALGRVLDIFSLSLFPYLFLYILKNPIAMQHVILQLGIFILLIIIFWMFLISHRNYSLKDSSLFLVVMITYANLNFLYNMYNIHEVVFMRFAFSDLVSGFFVFLAVLLLIKNENKFFVKK